MGFAFSVVTLSNQRVKVTTGTGEATITILFEVAGLPVTQERFEVMTHQTPSFGCGEYEYTGELVPVLLPLTFH